MDVPDQAKIRKERSHCVFRAGRTRGVNSIEITHNMTVLSMGLSDGSLELIPLDLPLRNSHTKPESNQHSNMPSSVPAAPSSPPSSLHGTSLPQLILSSDMTTARRVSGDGREQQHQEGGAGGQPMKRKDSGHTGCVSALVSQGNVRSPTFTSSVDGTIRQWTADTDFPASVLVGRHKGAVNGLGFSKDRRYLFSTSTDGTMKRWDLGNKAVRNNGGVPPGRIVTRFRKSALTLCVDAGGRGNIFVGLEGGDVSVVDGASGVVMRHLKGHTGSILCMDKNSEHRTLVTGSRDGTCRTWFAGRCQSVYEAHGCPVFAVRLIQSATACISAGADGIIHGWDAHASVPRIVYHGGHENFPIFALTIDSKTGNLYSAGSNGVVKLWESTTPCEFCKEKCPSLSKNGTCKFLSPPIKSVKNPVSIDAAQSSMPVKPPISAPETQEVQRVCEHTMEEEPSKEVISKAPQLPVIEIPSSSDSVLSTREEQEEMEKCAKAEAQPKKEGEILGAVAEKQKSRPVAADDEVSMQGQKKTSEKAKMCGNPLKECGPATGKTSVPASKSKTTGLKLPSVAIVGSDTRRKKEHSSAYPTLEPGRLSKASISRRKRLELKKKKKALESKSTLLC